MATRNKRQHHLDRAVVKTLRECAPRLVHEDDLIASVEIKADYLTPTPGRAEIEEAVRHAEREGRAVKVPTETGAQYQHTSAGEAWALANRL